MNSRRDSMTLSSVELLEEKEVLATEAAVASPSATERARKYGKEELRLQRESSPKKTSCSPIKADSSARRCKPEAASYASTHVPSLPKPKRRRVVPSKSETPAPEMLLPERVESPSPLRRQQASEPSKIAPSNIVYLNEEIKRGKQYLSEPVFVVDLETLDGFKYERGGYPIEVCAWRINEDLSAVKVFYSLVNPFTYPRLPETNWQDSWIFKNSKLKPDQIRKEGRAYIAVKTDLQRLLHRRYVTSYNRQFDLQSQLTIAPWSLNVKDYPCVMKTVAPVLGSMKWLKLQKAFETMFPHRPPLDWHSADADTLAATLILCEMVYRGVSGTRV